MRFNRSFQKQKNFAVIVFIFVLIYLFINLNTWQMYSVVTSDVCETPEHIMRELKLLVQDCHKILVKFKLTNLLIYGSLFGALRFHDILRWDSNIDIGLYWEELQGVNEEELLNEFHKHNISISYWHWKGKYILSRNNAHGDLIIFKKTLLYGERGRTGIEAWLFFVHFIKYHQAPIMLFEKPLPKIPFAGVNMSIPRGRLEIQKRFYPYNWWKAVKPKGCY